MTARWLTALLTLAFLASGAQAETFLVTRFDDPLPDACLPTDCSLREAAEAANGNDPFAETDRIELAAGSYALIRGALPLGQDLDLVGAGSGQTDVATDVELFTNPHDLSLGLHGLSIRTTDFTVVYMGDNGYLLLDDVATPIDGGGVHAIGLDSDLESRNSEFRDSLQCNQSSGTCTILDSRMFSFSVNPPGTGPSVLLQRSQIDGGLDPDPVITSRVNLLGGTMIDFDDSEITNSYVRVGTPGPQQVNFRRVRYIANADPISTASPVNVLVEDSEFRDNLRRAIYAENGSNWVIRGSSFVNNRVGGNAGGAIVIEDDTTVLIENSTFSGNSFTAEAAADGARGAAIGFRNATGIDLELRHVTIVPPAVTPVGIEGLGLGGVGGVGDVAITVYNSILRGSCRLDAGALFSSSSGNIESPGDTCGFDVASNQIEVSTDDLAIGALHDHGGPTPTYEPGPDSVAIDAAMPGRCPDTDQRGYLRPFGADCDVGAVEVGAEDFLFANGFDN